MTVPSTPNAYCVITGQPGKDPLTLIGPFVTIEDAQAHAAKHQQENPGVPAMADVLVNPVNC